MQVRPVSPDRLIEELADVIAARPRDLRTRVVIDGAPPTAPQEWADALVDPLQVRGRRVIRVRADDFLRPASLRFEHGRTDPDALYEDWLDTGGLVREVLDPLAPGHSGQVLPALWDTTIERAHRSDYVSVPPGGVLLLSGSLLLGRGLPVDLIVHFTLSPAALARRTPAELRWTLPAYERYDAEVRPAELAEVVVRLDDPRRPALVEPSA
ncbi:hypothetical protein [Actinopolymorpha alba]|uniref:hypothetical protein n=1 Tax=Actinopolymorpha alba TaxID=533267 RepID=UPI00036F7A70|nr:hypothetical protein [Actinopolymorpha alba]